MQRGNADVADCHEAHRVLPTLGEPFAHVRRSHQHVFRLHADIRAAQQIGDVRILELGRIAAAGQLGLRLAGAAQIEGQDGIAGQTSRSIGPPRRGIGRLALRERRARAAGLRFSGRNSNAGSTMPSSGLIRQLLER